MRKIIKKYQWLIFDADNTLFDYSKAERIALLKTLDKHKITYGDKTIIEIYHKINHRVWKEFELGIIKSQEEIKRKRTKQLFNALDTTGNADKFADDYLHQLSLNGHLLDNALKVIKVLSRQHKLVIMTNGMANVQRPRFNASPITQYFEHIIISEEIKYSKPSKAIFNHAFGLMDNPDKETVLMVGDSLASDVQGGINYGIDTAWYNPLKIQNKHSATYEIGDLLLFIQ